MITPVFIHLRAHSAYSLSKGAIKVADLPKLCKKHNMPALAITDINNLFGVMDIAKTLASNGVQHIIGSEITIQYTGNAGALITAPLLFYAVSEVGYKNLIKISSLSYQNPDLAEKGPYITLEHLTQHHEGMLCLTGGDSGLLAPFLQQKDFEKAHHILGQLKDLFPGNLYIELMRHKLPVQQELEPHFLELATQYDLPIVATNDVYFGTQDMFEAHDALRCIATSRYQS